MSSIWRSLLRDERGFVITAELVLISTVLVLGLVAALSAVKAAVAGELSDVAGAIGSLNQSYYTKGFHGCRSQTYGSSFLDDEDSSDELKADFATAINASCTTSTAVRSGTSCTVPVAPAPCGSAIAHCNSPCAAAPICAPVCGTSVPPVICPPGPRPFTGTDPFAPGAVSPVNMLLQGISYGGVCAPPAVDQPCAAGLPCADAVPMAPPLTTFSCPSAQPCASATQVTPACCEQVHAAPLPAPLPCPIY